MTAAKQASQTPTATALPKVSALVPCYNAAAFLQRTLDCLEAQTWPNLEILIADDCSKDATPAIVEAFAKTHANVRVLERTANLGWLRNTNDLMANAAGEFMFFAFHDDVVDPDYVEKLAMLLMADPGAVMAYSDMEVFEEDGKRHFVSFEAIDGETGTLRRGLIMARRGDGWYVPNRGLFRTSAFHAIGGIKPNDKGEYSADWTWLLHMALLGRFHRLPELLCHKYYQANSLSRKWPHDADQRLALTKAGIREISESRIGGFDKFILKGYLHAWKLRTHLRPKTRLRQLIGRG